MLRVKMTEAIRNQLKTVLGEAFDEEKVAVFEYVALGQNPLKSGRPFNGAKASENLMNRMKTLGENRAVPFIALHNKDYSLPQGRTFISKVYTDETGKAQLHALAYFIKPEVVDQIDTGILRDVSVGFGVNSATCSVCGFDFMGSQMGIDALRKYAWYANEKLTCANGHTMNEDGNHLWINGANYWDETSFVTRGASEEARFLSPQFQKLAKENFETIPLAASQSSGTLGANPSLDEFKVHSNFIQDSVDNKPKQTELNQNLGADPMSTIPIQEHLKLVQEKASSDLLLKQEQEKVTALTAQVAELQQKANASDGLSTQLQAEKDAHEQLKTAHASLKTERDAAYARLQVANLLDNDGKPKAAPEGNGDTKLGQTDTVNMSDNDALYTRKKVGA